MHSLLQRVPWAELGRLADERGADARARRPTTRTQLVAMLYGQLAGAASPREITTALASHRGRLYHLGARTVARSTPADADARRPAAAVSTGLPAVLMARAQAGLRRELADVVRLIGSTSLRLAGPGSGRARFAAGVRGARAHVVLDPDAAPPLHPSATPARVDDVTAARAMPVEAGATYVFDPGYHGYGWWARLDAQGRRIVTRLKRDTPLRVRAELPVPPGGPVLSDRIGLLPTRLAASRGNPSRGPVREVRVRTGSGEVLRVLSNDLDVPAGEIAALHGRRWDIELFFRRVRQTLEVKHFLGVSENAARIQLAVAMTAFLPLHLAHRQAELNQSPLAFRRLIRAHLMHRRTIDRLPETGDDPPGNMGRLALDLA